MIFDKVPKSVGSLTLSNALRIAFIILSRENRSFDPSRFVIVKFFISIAYFIFLGVYNSVITVYQKV